MFIKLILNPWIGMGPYLAVYSFSRLNGFRAPLDPVDSDTASVSTLNYIATHFLFATLVDFCYYWLHRSNHTTILWLGHSVHHDSDRYNLSTALRQGILQSATSFIFYLPLAVVISPRHYLTHRAIKYVIFAGGSTGITNRRLSWD